MPTLTTLRLDLRRLRLTDADFILELCNSPGWKHYIGDRGITTLAAAETYLQTRIIPDYGKLGFGFYLMIDRVLNQRVGLCGLVRRAALDDVDLGYALLPAFQKQGYAVEAAEAVLQFGSHVHGLSRIIAITTPDNQRSISLLEKLGMNFEREISYGADEELLLQYAMQQ